MSSKAYAKYMSSSQLFLLKKEKGKIFTLLQKKAKDTWAPNMWEAGACGHVDHGESPIDALIHEAKEEIGINIKKNNLKFISVVYKCVKNVSKEDHAFYNFSFYCTEWTGTPKICEPDKTTELKWFDINNLPKNIIPDRAISIKNYIEKKPYTEFNQKK